MSYTLSNIAETCPPGTILHYFGTTEPDGWHICDGSSKTATDSRYAALAPLLNATSFGNTNTANYIVTPNLTNKYIYSASNVTQAITLGTTTGNSSITFQTVHLPSHTHTFSGSTTANSMPDHSHTFQGQVSQFQGGGGQNAVFQGYGNGFNSNGMNTNSLHKHSFSGTTQASGSGTPFSLLPSSTAYTNFIIKY